MRSRKRVLKSVIRDLARCRFRAQIFTMGSRPKGLKGWL